MTHKPLNPLLKRVSASIAIIFTLLVLVGCASNKSTGATSVTDDTAGVTDDTVDDSLPPALPLDNFLNGIPNEIHTRANNIGSSDAVQTVESSSNTGAITHSSNLASGSGNRDTIDTLIAEVMALNGDIPTYNIDYSRPNPNALVQLIVDFDITTSDPSINVEHTTPSIRNNINLKRTAIEYEYDAGEFVTNRDYYLEVYTNYGESNRHAAGTTYDENNYLAIGTWLSTPDGRNPRFDSFYGLGAFVNGKDIVPQADIAAFTGSPVYTGAAYGFLAMYDTTSSSTNAEVVPVIADVLLTARFEEGTAGIIHGNITNFELRKQGATITDISGSLEIQGIIADPSNPDHSTHGRIAVGGFHSSGILTGPSSLIFGGNTHNDFSGDVSAQLYGDDSTGSPRRIAGTVAVESTTYPAANAALVLGWAAYRE